MHEPRTAQHPAARPLPVPLLLAFLVLPCLIELSLEAADAGWLATPRLRATVYQNGAFWAGLLDNWRPNYELQPATMFLTYSFLHAGFWHLAGNMIAFVLLIQLVRPGLEGWAFAGLYVASAIGGALAYALLGSAVQPVVGASGALFGLAGAWKWQDWVRLRGPVLPVVLRDIAVLVALNAVIWVVQDGALAWEAHLGGFVTGAAVMAALQRWRRGPGATPGAREAQ